MKILWYVSSIIGTLLNLAVPVEISAQWVQTSGPLSWNPIALLSVAISGDTMFTGGYQGDGIYRSFDGGDHWIEVAAGDTYSYINTLLIRNNVVYAGNYSGVYHSTDYGESWIKNKSGLPDRVNINDITFFNDYLFAASELGVYRSIDGGDHWVSVNVGLPGGICNNILSVTATNTTIFVGTYGGVYRSTNNGLSWISSSLGIPMGFYGCPARVNTMMVRGNFIFAGTDGYGLYRSDNNGQSWDSINTGIPPGYNSGFYMSIRSLESLHDTIIAGFDDGSISISADSGARWETLVSGLTSLGYVFDFAVNENKIFAAALDGMYQTNGIDSRWTLIFSRYPKPVVARKMAVGKNSLIVSGWSHSWNGSIPNIYYSSDGGALWYEIDSLSPVRQFYCFASGDSILVAGSDRIYRSKDDGFHWTQVDSSPGSSPINSIIIVDDTLYAATGGYWWQYGEWGGVYKSTDGARTWRLIGLQDTMVTSLTMVGDILIAAGGSSIHRSEDNGNSWNRSDSGFISSWGRRSLLTVHNQVIVWASDGIYFSVDSGRNWSARNNGLPSDTTNTVQIYSVISFEDKLFVGTNEGVYYSSDMGNRWDSITDNLSGSARSVYSMAIQNEELFAGTSKGIWRRPISNIVPVKYVSDYPGPLTFKLLQNYPNPFNPSTAITYTLPKASTVSLRIYDMLGREVTTLVNERKEVGHYTIEWDADAVPSGIYFYRIVAGDFTATHKMVLIK